MGGSWLEQFPTRSTPNLSFDLKERLTPSTTTQTILGKIICKEKDAKKNIAIMNPQFCTYFEEKLPISSNEKIFIIVIHKSTIEIVFDLLWFRSTTEN